MLFLFSLYKPSRALKKKLMTGNEPSSSLTYSTQAELKPNKAWLGLARLISTPTAN